MEARKPPRSVTMPPPNATTRLDRSAPPSDICSASDSTCESLLLASPPSKNSTSNNNPESAARAALPCSSHTSRVVTTKIFPGAFPSKATNSLRRAMPPRSTSAGYSHCGVETRNTRPAISAGDVCIHPNCVISACAKAVEVNEHCAGFAVSVKRLERFGIALHHVRAEVLHRERAVGGESGERALVLFRGGGEVAGALFHESSIGVGCARHRRRLSEDTGLDGDSASEVVARQVEAILAGERAGQGLEDYSQLGM